MKALEQTIHGVCRHADAGVVYRKQQHRPDARRARLRVGWRAAHAYRYRAAFGELDGVVDQVEQNLLEARGIHQAPGRNVAAHFKHKAQALGRSLRAHHTFDVLQQLRQVRGLGVDADFSLVQGRNIQNVVEHIEQVAGRGVGGLDVVGLLGVQARGAQQPEHAQNAVKGRAQFVAHIGQKFALAAVGALGLYLRFAEMRIQRLRLFLCTGLPAVLQPGGRSRAQQQGQQHKAQRRQHAVLRLHLRVLLL